MTNTNLDFKQQLFGVVAGNAQDFIDHVQNRLADKVPGELALKYLAILAVQNNDKHFTQITGATSAMLAHLREAACDLGVISDRGMIACRGKMRNEATGIDYMHERLPELLGDFLSTNTVSYTTLQQVKEDLASLKTGRSSTMALAG